MSGSLRNFNNVPTGCPIHGSHRSKLEYAVCYLLQAREKAGEIKLLQAEDHLTICGPKGHKCKKKITYIADFKCLDLKSGEIFWVEAKGYADEKWPMKKKLFEHYGEGRLEIWKGTWSKPLLDEVIIPLLTPDTQTSLALKEAHTSRATDALKDPR